MKQTIDSLFDLIYEFRNELSEVHNDISVFKNEVLSGLDAQASILQRLELEHESAAHTIAIPRVQKQIDM
jgi:hypothetical protein